MVTYGDRSSLSDVLRKAGEDVCISSMMINRSRR
jgi:hypothetical protein